MGTSGSLVCWCVCCEYWLYLSVVAIFVSCRCICQFGPVFVVMFWLCLSVVAVFVSCGCMGQFLLYAWSVWAVFVSCGCICQLGLICQLRLFVSLDLGMFYDRMEGSGGLVWTYGYVWVTCLLLCLL